MKQHQKKARLLWLKNRGNHGWQKEEVCHCNFNKFYWYFPWWGCRKVLKDKERRSGIGGRPLLPWLLNQAQDAERRRDA